MALTEITRREHDRSGLRSASDCKDEEWEIVASFAKSASKVARPRTHDLRNMWDAVQYMAATGCQWRRLPKDFSPFTTLQHYFYGWRDSGLIVAINEALVAANRIIGGRAETPTAAIIDSQSVKTTASGGARGYDAGKKSKGRKRHIATDTRGNMLDATVHTADVQDRYGAPALIANVRES